MNENISKPYRSRVDYRNFLTPFIDSPPHSLLGSCCSLDGTLFLLADFPNQSQKTMLAGIDGTFEIMANQADQLYLNRRLREKMGGYPYDNGIIKLTHSITTLSEENISVAGIEWISAEISKSMDGA